MDPCLKDPFIWQYHYTGLDSVLCMSGFPWNGDACYFGRKQMGVFQHTPRWFRMAMPELIVLMAAFQKMFDVMQKAEENSYFQELHSFYRPYFRQDYRANNTNWVVAGCVCDLLCGDGADESMERLQQILKEISDEDGIFYDTMCGETSVPHGVYYVYILMLVSLSLFHSQQLAGCIKRSSETLGKLVDDRGQGIMSFGRSNDTVFGYGSLFLLTRILKRFDISFPVEDSLLLRDMLRSVTDAGVPISRSSENMEDRVAFDRYMYPSVYNIYALNCILFGLSL